jgi:hypothetical protein
MKIIFNTVIDLETLQKMEAYIEKALRKQSRIRKSTSIKRTLLM